MSSAKQPGTSTIGHVTAVRPSAGLRFLRSAAPYLFLVPALLFVSVLLLYPFARSAYLSFTDYEGIGTPVWVGLENYRDLLNDPVLSRTLTNTMLWVIGTLILPVGLGLLIAVLSWNAKAGSIFRLPFLLPYALSGTAIATVWQFMLVRDGAINSVLEGVGLSSLARPWLLSPPLNTWSMIIASTWQAVGVSVLLFIIGLQVIPPEPIQAARLDGAEGWRLFKDMTLPDAGADDRRGGGHFAGQLAQDLRCRLDHDPGRALPLVRNAGGHDVSRNVCDLPLWIRLPPSRCC